MNRIASVIEWALQFCVSIIRPKQQRLSINRTNTKAYSTARMKFVKIVLTENLHSSRVRNNVLTQQEYKFGYSTSKEKYGTDNFLHIGVDWSYEGVGYLKVVLIRSLLPHLYFIAICSLQSLVAEARTFMLNICIKMCNRCYPCYNLLALKYVAILKTKVSFSQLVCCFSALWHQTFAKWHIIQCKSLLQLVCFAISREWSCLFVVYREVSGVAKRGGGTLKFPKLWH